MDFSDALYDLAAQREEQERRAAIDAARSTIEASGSTHCIECARPIPESRKTAAPFARRCVECQTIQEQEKYHR